ncbi:MAG: hypothetical protein R2822_06305 [Spirosomataceae bacterium]
MRSLALPEAIVFGNMNDPQSRISMLLAEEKEGRAFQMLEEINVKPQVHILQRFVTKDVEASYSSTRPCGARRPLGRGDWKIKSIKFN